MQPANEKCIFTLGLITNSRKNEAGLMTPDYSDIEASEGCAANNSSGSHPVINCLFGGSGRKDAYRVPPLDNLPWFYTVRASGSESEGRLNIYQASLLNCIYKNLVREELWKPAKKAWMTRINKKYGMGLCKEDTNCHDFVDMFIRKPQELMMDLGVCDPAFTGLQPLNPDVKQEHKTGFKFDLSGSTSFLNSSHPKTAFIH